MAEPHNEASVDGTVALYRGLKVAVYEVDKTDLNLTRNDLIELVNVSCSDDSLFTSNREKLINYPTQWSLHVLQGERKKTSPCDFCWYFINSAFHPFVISPS